MPLKISFLTVITVLLISITATAQNLAKSAGDYYQINIYHTASEAQADSVSSYLQSSYLPQLHKAGFKNVGVFETLNAEASGGKSVVVWLPLKSLEQLTLIHPNAEAPKYARLETIVLSAFPKAPHYTMPHLNGPKNERIFELRSYESPTEERYISKVKMFNTGDEVGLFARLNFNAVFYAHVIAGSRMPNLMYLTSFDNQAAHDAHWKAFNDDAYWKKLSAMPEYQKNVNKADIVLMHPTAYSDVY